MSETNTHYQVVVACVDRRQQKTVTGLLPALSEIGALQGDPYIKTIVGGAGVFASITDEVKRAAGIQEIKEILSLGVEEILLTLHGVTSASDDPHGCGGYGLANLGNLSEELLSEELKAATAMLRTSGIIVPIRMFIVTFALDGRNLLKEVFLDPSPIPQEERIAA